MNYLKKIFLILIFSICFTNLFSEENSPKPYSDDEFSQNMQDLRRFEIITLGSMPFVMLDTSIVYNTYNYISKKSPTLNILSTANYSNKEMTQIILTSFCISTSIGISDFVIRKVKRNRKTKTSLSDKNILINSIENDETATKVEIPQNQINDIENDSQIEE